MKTNEYKVKGTLILDLVRMIRKNKEKNWDQYFTSEDWKIINSKIAASAWYSIELYTKLGKATFEVIAGKDYKLVRLAGEEIGRNFFEGIYRAVISPSNPMRSLSKFVNIYTMMFNFSPLKMESIGDTHAKLQYDYDSVGKEGNCAFAHNLTGILDTLIKMSGGKNSKILLTQKQWENAPATVLDIQWT